MSRVVIQSQAVPLVRARVNSSTDASFPSRTATTTIPTSNDGVYDISAAPPLDLKIIPFGQSANDATFLMRIIGWMPAGPLYVPLDLWEGTITLGAMQGTGSWIPATTVASTSNGVSLPVGIINVASTTGFAASGTLLVNTSAGPQQVAYTGISGNSFTGCNLNVRELMGTGTPATGGAVSQYGVTGKQPVTASDFFADTIVTSVGTNGVDCEPVSPANDQIAHLIIDSKGCSYVECLFNMNGSASQANAMVAML